MLESLWIYTGMFCTSTFRTSSLLTFLWPLQPFKLVQGQLTLLAWSFFISNAFLYPFKTLHGCSSHQYIKWVQCWPFSNFLLTFLTFKTKWQSKCLISEIIAFRIIALYINRDVLTLISTKVNVHKRCFFSEIFTQIFRVTWMPCISYVCMFYSDSKVTNLLQDELGGNCKTRVLFCLKPHSNASLLSNSLHLAHQLSTIQNYPIPNDPFTQVKYPSIL